MTEHERFKACGKKLTDALKQNDIQMRRRVLTDFYEAAVAWRNAELKAAEKLVRKGQNKSKEWHAKAEKLQALNELILLCGQLVRQANQQSL